LVLVLVLVLLLVVLVLVLLRLGFGGGTREGGRPRGCVSVMMMMRTTSRWGKRIRALARTYND
jgi:hypothetical protein